MHAKPHFGPGADVVLPVGTTGVLAVHVAEPGYTRVYYVDLQRNTCTCEARRLGLQCLHIAAATREAARQ